MRARLLAAGMRSISNVVDITNYVMLALGSPLHAFDRSLLAEGRIVVRRAQPGEKIRTLDGHERELAPTDLVIADAKRPVAIAGIMGGEDSEVRDETTDLLLEAANFDALTVLRTSRRLRLRTDASTRWEKGVDPYAAEQAAIYASELLVAHAGASWTGHTDVHGDLPVPPVVRHRPELVERLSGMSIPVEEQVERLQRLGFEVDGDQVTVPNWRANDVTRPVDLVEEVVRFRIEEVPSTLPERAAPSVQLTREQRLRRRIEDVLVGAGFAEAYTWTLVPGEEGRLALEEPYTTELAALRTDLRLGLLESAERNRNAAVERIALFELARVFRPTGEELPEERWHVAGITDGGFFRAKGAAEALHDALAVPLVVLERGPGRSARTTYGELVRASRRVGVLRARRRRAPRGRPRGRRLSGRDHVPGRQAGPRLRRRRGRRGGRPDRGCARGGRPRAARRCASSTSIAASRWARARSRSRSRRPSSRRSARSRTRTPRSCASGSSPRSPSASAPSCARRPQSGPARPA